MPDADAPRSAYLTGPRSGRARQAKRLQVVRDRLLEDNARLRAENAELHAMVVDLDHKLLTTRALVKQARDALDDDAEAHG